MQRILCLSLCSLFFFATPATAGNTCFRPDNADPNHPGSGDYLCDTNHTTQPCEVTATGELINCDYSFKGSGKTSAKMSTGEIVALSVGVGLVVAGFAYYFFHKKPSKNNPGQISLMAF